MMVPRSTLPSRESSVPRDSSSRAAKLSFAGVLVAAAAIWERPFSSALSRPGGLPPVFPGPSRAEKRLAELYEGRRGAGAAAGNRELYRKLSSKLHSVLAPVGRGLDRKSDGKGRGW